MLARAALRAFDVAWMALLSVVVVAAWPRTAFAYVDPSVMTYTIQALAGVAVALSAVLGVAWRRIRKRLMAMLDIDENAGKTVEKIAHRVDGQTGQAVANDCDDQTGQPGSLGDGQGKSSDLSWKRRFALMLVASLFTVGTLFVVAPFELVMGNAQDLVMGIQVVGPIMTLFSLILGVILALLLSALRGKAFDVALAVMVAIGVCSVAQALFMNATLPTADGRLLVLGEFPFEVAFSLVVWLAILGACVTFAVRKPAFMRFFATCACCLLAVVQVIGVAGLAWSYAHDESDPGRDLAITEQGMLDVSGKSNVIVFVLDTTDTVQVLKDLRDYPDMAQEVDGFTFFPDSTGSLIPTRFGVPYLLTGKMPQPSETFDEYMVNRYQDSSFMSDIRDAGYSIGIYSDSVINGRPYLDGLAQNVHRIDAGKAVAQGVVSIPGTIGVMCQCALYRDLPWLAKPAFWYYTDWINTHLVDGMAAPDDPSSVPYLIDDAAYFQKLETRGLAVAEEGERGAFKFIHLLGSHGPYTLGEDARTVKGESDIDRQTRGSFHIVGEYVRQLKELGVYDQSTIIVTADHGQWINSVEDAWWISSPVMMVKPAGAKGSGLGRSNALTGHVDFQATVLDAMGSPKAADYGYTVWTAPTQGRTRYYCHLTHDHIKKIDYELEEFRIDGGALSFANWHLDGNRWVINDPAQAQEK